MKLSTDLELQMSGGIALLLIFISLEPQKLKMYAFLFYIFDNKTEINLG